MSQMIQVTAKVEGFRRAGRAWSTKPTVVSTDDFSKVQLEQLKEEDGRMLSIKPAEPGSMSVAEAISAMLNADPEKKNDKWWTKEGAPEVAELNRLTGEKVTKDVRDTAWEKFQGAAT